MTPVAARESISNDDARPTFADGERATGNLTYQHYNSASDELRQGPAQAVTNLEVALGYLRRGWFPIPLCWPTENGECGCGRHHQIKDIGKAPLLGSGYQHRKPVEEDVRQWWKTWPCANVGILLEPSGLLVVDEDSPEATKEVRKLRTPLGPVVGTGNGQHRYYRNTGPVGRAAKRGESQALDILASGYVVAPPSRHRNGHKYQWTQCPRTFGLREAPAWASAMLSPQRTHQEESQQVLTLPSSYPTVDVDTLNVSDRIKTIIRTGQDPDHNRYPSRSEPMFAVATAMASQGYNSQTILSVLWANPVGEKAREKGVTWTMEEIARACAKSQSTGKAATDTTKTLHSLHSLHPQSYEPQASLPSCTSPVGLIELNDSVPNEVEWLWPNFIPKGEVSMIFGDGGTGKTCATLSLVKAVAEGSRFPDGILAEPGRVLYIDGENGADEIKRRLWAMDFKAWKSFRILSNVIENEVSVPISLDRHQAIIKQAITEFRPSWIILDPLSSFHDRDERRTTVVRGLVNELRLLAEFANCAITCITHPNKNPMLQKQYRISGNYQYVAASRAVIMVSREEGTEERRFEIIKTNLGPTPAPLSFTIEDRDVRWIQSAVATKAESQREKAKRLLMGMLANGAVPSSAAESNIRQWGISERTVKLAKSELGIQSKMVGSHWWYVSPGQEVQAEEAA